MIERTYTHPCFMDHFADLISDRSTRYHKVRRMADQKKLRFVGYFRETGGRPRDVFCGWYPNAMVHEIKLTTALLALLKEHPLHVERGPNVDQKYRADADVFFPGGDTWRIEFDTGHQNYLQIENRWKVYESCPDLVLVITCRTRIEGLIERARNYPQIMHVTRFDDFVKDPWGNVLLDAKCERYSLKLSLQNVTD
jgi:hypothetical protein